MANLINLKRQHLEIREVSNLIEKLVAEDNIEKNSEEIAKNISLLAGKIKVHMGYEDRFLYPTLLKSNNSEVKNTTQEYINEMGDIANRFMDFKNNFNTRSKLLNSPKDFLQQHQIIFDDLIKRIEREDLHLYPLADIEGV